jgi:hypothetical protein
MNKILVIATLYFTEAERLSWYRLRRIQKPGFFQFCLLPRLAGGKVAVRQASRKLRLIGFICWVCNKPLPGQLVIFCDLPKTKKPERSGGLSL